MTPHITASPAKGVTTADIPTPTAKEIWKRQETSTQTVKHAMSTPYVFPEKCALSYMFTMTSRSSFLDGPFGTAGETYLYASRSERRGASVVDGLWHSCQPTGSTIGYNMGRRGLSSEVVYRGALCPAGWIAHDIGLTSRGSYMMDRNLPQTWSTAICCASGDLLVDDRWSINRVNIASQQRVCVSTLSYPFDGITPPSTHIFYSYPLWYYSRSSSIGLQYTTIDGNNSTSTMTESTTHYFGLIHTTTMIAFTKGRAFYPPISLEWIEEDNTTLNPQWPTLTSNMLLPTWPLSRYEEEQQKESGIYDNRGLGRIEVASVNSMPMKVAIPIISVLAILLSATWAGTAFLFWKGKRERRLKLGVEKNQQQEIPLQDELRANDLELRLDDLDLRADDMELRAR